MAEKRIVMPVEALLNEIEPEHGLMAFNREAVVLAMYIYIHDHYGLESLEYTRRLRYLGFQKEIFVLNLAKSPHFNEFFSRCPFPTDVYYLKRIYLNEKLLIIEVTDAN